ncbi:MAG: hypothetical protein MZV49_08605 [Rhodopseudomonas palustris]|nr:hypothetical protein [Rhodopseudomonas palustris]
MPAPTGSRRWSRRAAEGAHARYRAAASKLSAARAKAADKLEQGGQWPNSRRSSWSSAKLHDRDRQRRRRRQGRKASTASSSGCRPIPAPSPGR